MKVLVRLAAVLAALPAPGVALPGLDCAYREPRDATVDAAGAKEIRIVARAGFLRVEGRSGLTEVRAQGTACADTESLLDQIRLSATRSGDRVRIEVEIPENRGFWDHDARLDLSMEVPDTVPLVVRDSSGPLELRGVASAEIEDSSGEMVILDVAGNLTVDDSSGEIEIARIGGSIRLQDSSGEIDIREVGGSVDIVQDSSGDIDIAGVGGNVLIRRDSSGGIDVRDVEGDFTVEHDGSGGIRHRNVKGAVQIPERHR